MGENPIVIFDRFNQIPAIYKNTIAIWPNLNFQWIEDRFWVWIHYAATELGRGEFFEAIDFLAASLTKQKAAEKESIQYNSR
ncbi:hypothetical protein [Leptospira vanthielii]|uniref:Uncharacterized protein n=1 Tax=Leptospira vanthielii serovar Holland str. Waz Holland = ATCC 700522 TaxID=1218591 RepID=N1WHI8_9LEPT|nr:hypothetical protein [Leptospira vanthielii]EMY71326.1 hypothetical protein LEP1GSC199_3552 [Leptospira vanthielii serovar Holland str. Waz Holland = ATCC 700522]